MYMYTHIYQSLQSGNNSTTSIDSSNTNNDNNKTNHDTINSNINNRVVNRGQREHRGSFRGLSIESKCKRATWRSPPLNYPP